MSKSYLIVGVILGIILTYFVMFIFLSQSEILFKNSQTKVFIIGDECGVIVGNLLHSIKDDAACRMQCRAKCQSNDIGYDNSIFNKGEDTCNSCECHCK